MFMKVITFLVEMMGIILFIGVGFLLIAGQLGLIPPSLMELRIADVYYALEGPIGKFAVLIMGILLLSIVFFFIILKLKKNNNEEE